jgi:hypothetical protein
MPTWRKALQLRSVKRVPSLALESTPKGIVITRGRRFLAGGFAALLTALLTASSVAAAPPVHLTFPQDQTVRLSGSSRICGFDVFVRIQGDRVSTIFFDADGNVTRETLTSHAYKWTFFSPITGRSYTTIGTAPVHHIDYTGNAGVGTAATLTYVGFIDDAAEGGPPSAGRVQFAAVVTDVSSDGLFRTLEIGEQLTSAGARTDIYPFADCTALSAVG